jgi:hypothetical protein
MKTTRRVLVSIIYLAVGMGMLFAPATAILTTAGSAAAAPATWTIPLRGGHGGHGGDGGHGGYGGSGFGGPHVDAPYLYGGNRDHSWLWLYGPGAVGAPHVDTTVHQSR